MGLDKEIQYIKGVGENRAKSLNKLGIFTLEDLITYYPRDYEDRSKAKPLRDVFDGEEVLIKANVVTPMQVTKARTKRMTICKVIVSDRNR